MLQLSRVPLFLCLLAGMASGTAAAGRGPQELSDAELVAFLEGRGVIEGRCGTPYAAEAQARGLTADLALAPGDTLYHETDGGHFRIAYQTEGDFAVDLTDLDLSGVPDYVEQVGSAFERSWTVEIDSLGFPALDLGGERYFVSLIRDMPGEFGVTYESFSRPGGSWIAIRRSMADFCNMNPDPQTCETNALIVTIAHEFKHAIQLGDGWTLSSLSGWMELDATWIEDIVFDDSNDYYQFMKGPNSPFTVPTASLTQSPGYEDCTWQHWLSENWGADFLVDWGNRVPATQFGPGPQVAYVQEATARGIDWEELWGGYTVATYLSGTRAASGIGFVEAAGYPTSAIETMGAWPYTASTRPLADMAMRFHHVAVSEQTTGRVDIGFDGSFNASWTVRAVFQRPDLTVVEEVPVTANSARFRTQNHIEDFDSFALLVGNSTVPGPSTGTGSYSATVGVKLVGTEPTSVGGFKSRFRRGSTN